jgi:hypothetical protein
VAGVARGCDGGAAARLRGGGLLEVDVSADGQSLIVARDRFTGGPLQTEADLRRFVRTGDGFVPDTSRSDPFAATNSRALEYAPAITADGLTLCVS